MHSLYIDFFAMNAAIAQALSCQKSTRPVDPTLDQLPRPYLWVSHTYIPAQ